MASHIRPEDDPGSEAAEPVRPEWLRPAPEGTSWITGEGEGASLALKGNAPALRAAPRAGISEEDYVTTVKVLRRFVRNAGGTITP
ncbi:MULTISPECIES: hypothetical protein [Streptomyces]|uniref:hypothetical protein n=1 Tax=Streptomyces TaxID=1883 RepID=UPI00067BEFA4|nr:hypothetical protein [Streptomyces californicus]NEA07803.1 hypothetical protein [Streptomyces sp. SID10692]QRV55142.1 hypothetical protein I6J40_13675 [Streptomyces californicus]